MILCGRIAKWSVILRKSNTDQTMRAEPMHIKRIRIEIIRTICYNKQRNAYNMPIKPRELEKEILDDGWIFKSQEGSHRHYIHPKKKGKVTIPFHSKDIPKKTENSIRKQAGLR